jgi:integrase
VARIIGRLTAKQVANSKPPKGRDSILISDGGCLHLQVTSGHAGHVRRSWTFKYQLAFRRREMGLGPFPDVSLAEARAKAHALRAQLREDIDPLEQRQERRRALLTERAKAITFAEVAGMVHRLHAPGWRNPKHAREWMTSLERYALPKLGALAVADIDAPAILKAIEPIWLCKTVTAGRVLNRVQVILDYAIANGFRPGPNPAASVLQSLPKRSVVAPVEHFRALEFTAVPAFMAELRNFDTPAARALEFTVLTAGRVGMTINATWDEIDGKVWTVPGIKMKKGKPHRTPLCDRALDILHGLPRTDARIFSGLEDHHVDRALKRLRPDVSIHGFRSSFRDWASERTSYPHAVVEQALAHAIPSATEKAYRRGDLFQKRERLMREWAAHCCGPTSAGAAVVPMRKATSC